MVSAVVAVIVRVPGYMATDSSSKSTSIQERQLGCVSSLAILHKACAHEDERHLRFHLESVDFHLCSMSSLCFAKNLFSTTTCCRESCSQSRHLLRPRIINSGLEGETCTTD